MLEPASSSPLLENFSPPSTNSLNSSPSPDSYQHPHQILEIPDIKVEEEVLPSYSRSNSGLLRERRSKNGMQIMPFGTCSCTWNDLVSYPVLGLVIIGIIFGTLIYYSTTGVKPSPHSGFPGAGEEGSSEGNRAEISFSPSSELSPPPSLYGKRGAWYYPRGESVESVKAAVNLLQLDFLVISAGAHELSEIGEDIAKNSLVELIVALRGNGSNQDTLVPSLRIVLMTLQGPRFALESNLPSAIKNVEKTLRVCQLQEVECQQIHFDIEPHILPEWAQPPLILPPTAGIISRKIEEELVDEHQRSILSQMTKVQAESKELVAGTGGGKVSVTMAMTWWFPTESNLNDSLTELAKTVDVIYIMAYGGIGKDSEGKWE
jgi:hypothetical protein